MINRQETIKTGDFSIDGKDSCTSHKDLPSCITQSRFLLPSANELENAEQSHISELSPEKSFQLNNQFPIKAPILLPASSTCLRCLKSGKPLSTSSICAPCHILIFYRQQIAQGRLSNEHWAQARVLLEIPENFSDYSTADVGRGHNLINWMIEKLSPEWDLPQIALAELMLESHTTLSKKSRQQIKKLISGQGQKKIQNSNTQTKSASAKSQKAAKSNRKPVSQYVYNEVAVRQGSFCYWCGIAVVREQSIPVAERVNKSNSTILYYAGGELSEAALGTIDHLVRVADGGNNQTENLVISCAPCNIERDRQMLNYNQLISRRRIPCHNCGGRFFHIDWGCCSICGAGPLLANESPKVLKTKRRSLLILKIVRSLTKLVYRARH